MSFSDKRKPPQALSQKIRIFFMTSLLVKQYWISRRVYQLWKQNPQSKNMKESDWIFPLHPFILLMDQRFVRKRNVQMRENTKYYFNSSYAEMSGYIRMHITRIPVCQIIHNFVKDQFLHLVQQVNIDSENTPLFNLFFPSFNISSNKNLSSKLALVYQQHQQIQPTKVGLVKVWIIYTKFQIQISLSSLYTKKKQLYQLIN